MTKPAILFSLAGMVATTFASGGESNSIGIELVDIEPGSYQRGFPDGGSHDFNLAHPYSNSQDFKLESPAHKVEITRSFSIGKTEVTVGQFKTFVAATGYVTTAEKSGGGLGWFPEEKNYVDRFHKDPAITWKSPGFDQTDEHPVVCVSWTDAQAFCKWLSGKEGKTYRLPTEAEWEYACRAGTETWYSWGEKPDEAYKSANVADSSLENAYPMTTQYQRAIKLGKEDGDNAVFTAKVASYRANPWKLHDMHGNVWEWCQDRWKADLYKSYFEGVARQDWPTVAVKDPKFEEETSQHEYGDWRVMRGGAWTCAPAAVRSTIRTFAEAGDATIYTGFRVVRK